MTRYASTLRGPAAGFLLGCAALLGAAVAPAEGQTFTLPAAADTFLRDGAENRTSGSDTTLQLSGNHRALVRIDQAAIAGAVGSGRLVSATLELYVRSASGWGADGRAVEAHRLSPTGTAWTEAGATWSCPVDSLPSNSRADCATQWAGGAFEEDSSDTVLHTNAERLRMQFDVTEDVAAFLAGTPNRGWLLKREEEAGAGRVDYASREGAAAERPRLVLLVETAANDQVPPALALTAPSRSILVNEPSPTVTLAYSDGGSGADLATLRVLLDGVDVTAACTVGGTSATCRPAPLAAGSHSLQAQLRDRAGNLAQASFAFQLLLGPGPHLASFPAVADTYLRKGEANRNFGAETVLRVREGGQNRALVRFDPQALASTLAGGTLVSAALELHIQKNGRNWGREGRPVGAHRLTSAWTEGGATWSCATDTNLSNNQPECPLPWAGGTFVAAPTATVLHTRDLGGWVSYNVTPDVAAFLASPAQSPHQGWILKKGDERKSGRVDYDSRQIATADGPRLTVVFTTPPPPNGDTTPPLLDLVSPTGTAAHGPAMPPVSATYSDDGSGIAPATFRAEIDGVALACTAGATSAQCPIPTQAAGSHGLSLRVRDQAGNLASYDYGFRTVTDLDPPVVAITSPADGAFVASAVTPVAASFSDAGSGIDPASVSLRIDGSDYTAEATITPSGLTWSAAEGLGDGLHSVVVEVADGVGRTASAASSFTVDTLPPALTLDEPAEGLATNGLEVAVRGEAVDDQPGLRVEIAGQPTTLSVGAFSAVVPLAEGVQTLVVRAVDLAGNASQEARQVSRFTLPSVVITAPADLGTIAATTVTVSGSVSDPGATVTVNGIAATVAGSDFAAHDVPLIEGGNLLTATARAASGHIGTATINVVRDLTAPEVLIRTPVEGSRLPVESVTVAGMVNDIVDGTVNAAQATVTVNGRPAAVVNRTFLAAGVPLAAGDNLLTAVATDASGNRSEHRIAVRRIAPGVARLAAVSGDLQAAPIGTELPQPLTVVLLDAAGAPVSGYPVHFAVGEGSGVLRKETETEGRRQVAVATGPDGRASVRFTLGSRAGVANHEVEVSAAGFAAPLALHASATHGPAARIVADAGMLQVGVTGQTLPRPLVAVVTDSGFNRLPGVAVRLRVVTGGGALGALAGAGAGETELVAETDGDGRVVVPYTLGPDEGVGNNVAEATIDGLDGGPRASFVASAWVAGDPAATAISGIVLDNSNQPVPGVTLRLKEQPGLTSVADGQGTFRLAGAPVGTFHLIVDGSTEARPGSWPDLEFVITTIAGRENTVQMPIYLLPIDLAHGMVIDETRGGTITLPEYPGFSLQVAPGSVTFPGGSRSGLISVTSVHPDKVPMAPNFGQQPRFIVTIQPAGARFDPPARLVIPNLEGLSPGAETEMYSFDHDLARFVSIGPGTVSDDGIIIVSNPGVGVIKAGWHSAGDPDESGTPNACPTCMICDGNTCVPGCATGGAAQAGPPEDDGLNAIFAAACVCSDNDPCTFDDHCVGGSARNCVGTPLKVTAIAGFCAAPASTPITFTATSNKDSLVQWDTTTGGTPARGTGKTFTTRWPSLLTHTVRALCGPRIPPVAKQVRILKKCSAGVTGVTYTAVTPAVPAGKHGWFESTGMIFNYSACADSPTDNPCLLISKLEAPNGYKVLAAVPGAAILESENDPLVTATTCKAILDDITPSALNEAGTPPLRRYWSPTFSEHHEQKHQADFKAMVAEPTYTDLKAAFAAKCDPCASPPAAADVQAIFTTINDGHRNTYNTGSEDRAYAVSNAEYLALANKIRARAVVEGWPQNCRPVP